MGNGETLAYNMLPDQEQIGRGVLLLFGKLPRRRPRIFPGNWFFDNWICGSPENVALGILMRK